MSKQFINVSTISDAHASSLLSLDTAPSYIITGSGTANLKIHSTTEPGYPILHEFVDAHSLGCHHISTSDDGAVAISAGFEGQIKLWDINSLSLKGTINDDSNTWAVAISGNGLRCAITSHDGRIGIWDLGAHPVKKTIEYETKGSFGSCVTMSQDGKLAASGHENGGIYIFNNESERLLHSLIGLAQTVRDVAFAPDARLLAVCGDFLNIYLYDVHSGEQVLALNGHTSWVFSVGWNTAATLLVSSSLDGKAKVWSLERKECVATVAEAPTSVFKARYLPQSQRSTSEEFVAIGDVISFYREAAK